MYIRNYRLPHAHKAEIGAQVQKLLEDTIIEQSVSPYNAPQLLVPKYIQTDLKKYRLVVDFRQLNDRIVNVFFNIGHDKFIPPDRSKSNIKTLHSILHNKRAFSVYQVAIWVENIIQQFSTNVIIGPFGSGFTSIFICG